MIKNKGALVSGKFARERKKALQIIEEGLKAVQVKGEVKKAKLPDLRKFDKVYVVAFGKASAKMAEAMEERLGNRITDGAVVSIRKAKTKRMKAFKGTHPVPSAANVKAAEYIVEIVEKAKEKDLVIALVSGGGSALLTLPAKGLTISDMKRVTTLLLRSTAKIKEINAVRKHLSQVKGGRLAKLAYPARLVALQISDVFGDDVAFMASGATCPDKSTRHLAIKVLKRHRLWGKVPKSVREHLQKKEAETPNKLKLCNNIVIVNNQLALKAMQKKARGLGFKPLIYSNELDGEAEHLGRFLLRKAFNLRERTKKPIALIAGGETTVTITGKGTGGRNQEVVLGAVRDLEKAGKTVFVSVGSDGIDGNSKAAGAIADSGTMETARVKKLSPRNFLARNDSNTFFKKVKGEIVTGYTETNVMDLQLLILWN